MNSTNSLNYKHAVTIAVETVFRRDGVPVSTHYKFVTAESRSQQKQRALWQVKIGQQCSDRLEAISRGDRQICQMRTGDEATIFLDRRFERARRCRPNGNDPTIILPCLVHNLGGLL